jgi:hypothetical protein
MVVLLLLVRLVFAEILILSPNLSQGDAKGLSQDCLTSLEGEVDLEVRISRFFVTGEGYQYKVVVAGFSSEKSAHTIYKKLQDVNPEFELQLDTQVFDVEKPEEKKKDKKDKKRKEEESNPSEEQIELSTENASQEEKKSFSDRLIPSSVDVLSHAQDAHKLIHNSWEQSDAEHFIYTRKLPQDGVVVKHDFYRQKDAMRLDVVVSQGSGTNSTTVLPGKGDGWVESGDKVVSRNAIRTKELLERFSSRNILSIPFHFAIDVQTSSSWQDFYLVEDGGENWILSANKTSGLIDAGFYKNTWLLSHITVSEGANKIEYEFRDYRDIGVAGKVPHIVNIYNDGILTEEIEIEKLELNPELAEDLFTKKD